MMTSSFPPTADSAETKLSRPSSRPRSIDRMVSAVFVCCSDNRNATLKQRWWSSSVGATWLLDSAKTSQCPLSAELASEVELPNALHHYRTPTVRAHESTDDYSSSRAILSRSITMAPVSFWTTPFQYIHWASRAKPAIFWSIVVGSCGPIMVVCTRSGRREQAWYTNMLIA